jgi:hypothetical protein
VTPEALGVPNRVHTTEKPSMTNWSFASSTNPIEGSGATPNKGNYRTEKLNKRKWREKKSDNKIPHHTVKKVQITRQNNRSMLHISEDNSILLNV